MSAEKATGCQKAASAAQSDGVNVQLRGRTACSRVARDDGMGLGVRGFPKHSICHGDCTSMIRLKRFAAFRQLLPRPHGPHFRFTMKLKVYRNLWGVPGPRDKAVAESLEAGYHGIEAILFTPEDHVELRRVLRRRSVPFKGTI